MRRTDGLQTTECVLLVGLGWPSHQAGGVNRYVEDLVAALGQAGQAVELVVVGPASDVPDGATIVSAHDAPLPQRLVSLFRSGRVLAPRATVVDVHFALYGAPVLLAAGRRTPVVAHFHGPWSSESEVEARGGGLLRRAPLLVKGALERWVLRRAAVVSTVSHAFARLVISELGVSPWKVEIAPPGVDLHRFAPGDRVAARERMGVPPGSRVVVTARRLVDRVGVDLLLDAWRSVVCAVDDPSLVLLIAGDGPRRRDLEQQAAALGIARSVRFLGRIDDDELPALYCAADLAVVPSRALEGFGLVVLEALACGTPVIATQVGGLPEVLEPLGEQLVVAPNAAAIGEALAAALGGHLEMPTAGACRAHAERYDWASAADAAIAQYLRAQRGDRRPRRVVVCDSVSQVGRAAARDDELVHTLVLGSSEVSAGATGARYEILGGGPARSARLAWRIARLRPDALTVDAELDPVTTWVCRLVVRISCRRDVRGRGVGTSP
jgi:glycosyltransferase involved in cell wall biosynthesis